jgi:hypothetical protein
MRSTLLSCMEHPAGGSTLSAAWGASATPEVRSTGGGGMGGSMADVAGEERVGTTRAAEIGNGGGGGRGRGMVDGGNQGGRHGGRGQRGGRTDGRTDGRNARGRDPAQAVR